jgi:D-serine deaminase-like pyridoxal phosphate-dependent protein
MWESAALRPTISEYRVGTYVFFDRNCLAEGAARPDDIALTVLTTVVSRPARERAILDAGSKTLTSDTSFEPGYGLILEAQRSRIARLSEEHGHVELADGDALELGQRVHVVPNHVCPAVNLADELWVRKDGAIVDRWPVAARGRTR